MFLAWLRLSGCGIVLGITAGCGGGSGGSGGGTGGGGGTQPTAVTFQFEGAAPTALAAKIGTGAFTRQTLTSSQLTLSLPSGTADFAVAYICPPAPLFETGVQIQEITVQSVVQENLAGGTSYVESCNLFPPGPSTATLTGTVDASALAGVSYVSIHAGNANGTLSAQIDSLSGSFSFAAPAGSDRVEVLAFSESPLGSLPLSSSVVAVKTFDNQPVPGVLNGGAPIAFTAADRTTLQPITYQNVPPGYTVPSSTVFLYTGNQGVFPLAWAATDSYPVPPDGALRSGDSYGFVATAYQGAGLGPLIGPAARVLMSGVAGGPKTFSFPSPWNYSGPAPAALPAFDFAYSGFAGKKGVRRGAILDWPAGSANSASYVFSLSSSAAYQGGASTLRFPDLSSLPGFLPPPASGISVFWSANISYAEKPSMTSVESSGEYTVP